VFKKTLNRIASVLPWGLKQAFEVAALLVGVLEDCGLQFTAGGIAGTLILFAVLKGIVAIGGPIPLTPAVIVGLNLWLVFQVVVLVHTCVDGILIVSGEGTL
jgi:hypothetical protein